MLVLSLGEVNFEGIGENEGNCTSTGARVNTLGFPLNPQTFKAIFRDFKGINTLQGYPQGWPLSFGDLRVINGLWSNRLIETTIAMCPSGESITAAQQHSS